MCAASVKESIFFLLPQGKPDPKIARPEEGEDTRERVVQKSPQGPICWYYALKFLREQYGPKAPACFLKQRVLEKLISSYRKALTEARKETLREEELVHEYRSNPLLKKLVQASSPEAILVQSKISYGENSSVVKLAELMKDFSAQIKYTDLSKFAYCRKLDRTIAIHAQYLKILKTDPHIEFEKERALRPWQTLELEKLPYEFQATFFSTLAIRTIARDVYQMRESRWSPHQPVTGLIQELIERGPMFMSGLFGRTFYHADCQPLDDKLHGKTIWCWPVGSAIETDGSSPTHSIIVIGADHEGSRGGRVYFIDPSDGSDPADPERQKVYAMSYLRLAEKIFDLFGEKFSKLHHSPLIPFALHGPLRFTPAANETPEH
ncbi:MAG: hypothetical protein KF898_06910 [Parachlamydiales bacterium]|nr:hypothetical protein [Verrucomicrobiota bacterium]MBX3719362.1 hypothetical protein [Candidatus Acheromyda pituitae]